MLQRAEPAEMSEVMTMCEKCGAEKRRWSRSCPRCSPRSRRETAADAADLAVPAGLFEWMWLGAKSAVRLVLRALN